jgi:hypothetical protein
MIAGLVPSANLAVDIRVTKLILEARRKKKVIEPETSISTPGIPEIIPEGVDPFSRMARADSISPPLVEEALISPADLGPEQGVIDPSLRFVDVELSGHDVEIPDQHDRSTRRQQGGRMVDQPIEPCKLVIEFRTGCWISVGEIEASYQNAFHRRFNVAAVLVRNIAW